MRAGRRSHVAASPYHESGWQLWFWQVGRKPLAVCQHQHLLRLAGTGGTMQWVGSKAVIHRWPNCPPLNHRTADKATRYLDSEKSYGYPCGA